MDVKRRNRLFWIIFGSAVAFIAAIKILGSNYLLPWQIPLYKDRKAIVEYVRENHPKSTIAKEHIQYRVSGYLIFNEFIPDCYITFEEDGFQYLVYAHDGKVYHDLYSKMKLRNEVSVFINDEFLKPRGIENVDISCTFDPDDDELPSEWSEYRDRFWVKISVRGQGKTPQEVGWLWDFASPGEIISRLIPSGFWNLIFITLQIRTQCGAAAFI